MTSPRSEKTESIPLSENDGQDEKTKTRGLGVLGSSMLLLGEIAGTGVMALPEVIDQTGLIGVLCLLVLCGVCGYTGHILGQSWLIVQDRYDEFKGHVRHPYPSIAFVTFGSCGRAVLSFCSNFTMFCACAVILIVASQNIHSLLFNIFGVNLAFCYLLIILTVFLLPFSWLGTPKDIWVLGVIATVSTLVAVVLLLGAIGGDALTDAENHSYGKVHHTTPTTLSFFTAIGSMLYMTGGHYAFPTVQNDMKQPRSFRWTILCTYSTMVFLYLPLAILGYYVYGNRVAPNILLTLTPGPLTYLIQALVTLHTMCAMIINMNPLLQHSEEVLRLPLGFSWKQVALRSCIFVSVLLVCLSIPKFGIILSLTGGTANTMIAWIFPALCYLKLCHMEGHWPKITVPLHVKVFLVEVVGVGILIGVMATIGNVIFVFEGATFTFPCFVDMAHASND